MLKNKKKLRRLERKTPGYAVKTAQSLVLAGALVLGGAGVASAALTAGENWGDQVVTGPAATGNGDSLWRDGKILPGTPNNGDITLNGGTFTVGGAGTGATGTTVGNGNVHVTSGGIDVNGGNLWINQGNLTFENGTSLKITSAHSLIVHGDIKVNGTLAADSGVAAGVLHGDNTLDFGNNTLTVSGTGTVRAETIIAKSLNLSGTLAGTSGGGSTFNALKTLTATGADSVIDTTAGTILLGDANFGDKALAVQQTGTGTVIIKNLTVGALTLGNAGAGAGAGVSKVTVNGNMNAGTVVINAGTVGDGVLTLGANPSDTTVSMQGEHSTAGVTITQGTLALVGRAEVKDADGEITTGAVGQTLTGNVALNAALASPTNAKLTTNGGSHTLDSLTVASNKSGSIEAGAADKLTIQNVSLNGNSTNGAALTVNGNVNSTVRADNLNLTYGAVTLTSGILSVGEFTADAAANSTLNLNGANATLKLDGNYTTGNKNSATSNVNKIALTEGKFIVGGKLTLTNDAAFTIGSASAGDNAIDDGVTLVQAGTLDLSTPAKLTLGVDNANTGNVTIVGTSGNDAFTNATGIDVLKGTLRLGADVTGGTVGGKFVVGDLLVNANSGGATDAKLSFGHGDFTIGSANSTANKLTLTEGTVELDDVSGFEGKNNLTIYHNNTAAGLTVGQNSTLSLKHGNFVIAGGATIDNGSVNIDTDAGKTGSLDKLTLGGANLGALTTTGHEGTYTIGNLLMGHNSSTVTVSAGKVITTTLDANGKAVATGQLEVSAGTWQIGNILKTGGGSIADFTTSGTGTLLIDQDITLANSSTDSQFTIGSDDYVVKGTAGSGTIGSTGVISIAGVSGNYTVGTTNSSANGTKHNIQAQQLTFTGTNAANTDLVVGNDAAGVVGLTGNGTSFTNAKSISLGNNGNTGTLVLGATDAPVGTVGGTYGNLIKVGGSTTSGDNGTLTFLGGDFTLSKLHLNTGANGSATVNLAGGKGKLTITTTDNAGANGVAGLVLAGNTSITDNALNVGTGTVAGVHTDYEIVGGVTVTKGTVTFGNANGNSASNVNILNNDIKLNGAAVGDSNIKIDGGINLVSSITVADAKTGQINLNKGTLAVDSNLVLNKAAIYAANDAAGATLVVNGDLTTGTVTYGAALSTVGSMVINNTSAHNMTIAANKWTVLDNAGAASSITVNAGDAATNLNLEIGSGGITASDFNIATGTVNLLGTGGKIALSSTVDNKLDVTGANSTLNVGALATKDDAVVSPNWSAGTVNLDAGNLKVTSGQLISVMQNSKSQFL